MQEVGVKSGGYYIGLGDWDRCPEQRQRLTGRRGQDIHRALYVQNTGYGCYLWQIIEFKHKTPTQLLRKVIAALNTVRQGEL